MDEVWTFSINIVGSIAPPTHTRPIFCWTNADAAKRYLDRMRLEKITWRELPTGTWVGEFRHKDHKSKMIAFVYSIALLKDE